MEPSGLFGNPWVALVAILLVAWSLTALVFGALAVLRARCETRMQTNREHQVATIGRPVVARDRKGG